MLFYADLPVTPRPWTAPKLGEHGVYSVHNDFKKKVRCLIAEKFDQSPYPGYVIVHMIFNFPIPKKATKRQRQKMLNREIFPNKGDCTNCQKLFEDCLNKLVITDDRNVVMITSAKFYSEEPGVTIAVNEYDEHAKEDSMINEFLRGFGEEDKEAS